MNYAWTLNLYSSRLLANTVVALASCNDGGIPDDARLVGKLLARLAGTHARAIRDECCLCLACSVAVSAGNLDGIHAVGNDNVAFVCVHCREHGSKREEQSKKNKNFHL